MGKGYEGNKHFENKWLAEKARVAQTCHMRKTVNLVNYSDNFFIEMEFPDYDGEREVSRFVKHRL